MEMSAQTLVLIDNSLSVSKVNQEITKETLKYLFAHSPENRAYCFTPFSHTLEYVESYTDDYVGLKDMAERLTYENKETSLTDVVTMVMDKWEQGDFACRDILIFTDGLEEKSINYQKEELFYLLEHNSYPVYIVCLDQKNNNEAVKNLSAICRVSGGKLFHTEFEGSDAEVEIKLTNQIFDAMNNYSEKNWKIYEDEMEESKNGAKEEGEDLLKEEITEVIEENETESFLAQPYNEDDLLYELEKPEAELTPLTYAAFGGILFIIICGIFLSWCLFIKHKQKTKIEEEEYRRRILEKVEEKKSMAFTSQNEMEEGETVSLIRRDGNNYDMERTRLLSEHNQGGKSDISFEDVSDPSKYFKIRNKQKIILGRNSGCDVVLDYDDSVSGRHCEISFEDGIYYITDLNSSNGTYINGEKIHSKTRISSNDMLGLGLLSVIVRLKE